MTSDLSMENGGVFAGRYLIEPGGPIAVRGVAGCRDVRCTQPFPRDDYHACMGYHCGRCGAPSSYQGHMSTVAWREAGDDERPFGRAVTFPYGAAYFSCSPEYEAAVITLRAALEDQRA